MSVLIFLIITYILFSITLMKVFEKAGVAPTKALIPGVNFAEMAQLVGRKKIYALWLLFPIVNIFIFVGLCVDLVRSFGKYRFRDSALAVVFAPAIFYMIGKNAEDKYLGPTLNREKEYMEKMEAAKSSGKSHEYKKLVKNNPYHKSQLREWAEAIVFAVFAAAFIRMFLIEAYKIPTTSMEGSLLQGDHLFISKLHYGLRMPQTIAMFPLLHNRIPILNTESYLESPSLSYFRFPAIEKVDNMDMVVFNYPEGDSVYLHPQRAFSVYDTRRNPGLRREIKRLGLPLISRPVDKMDHYVKRCVGIAGDSLQIIDRQLYINGKPAKNPDEMQFQYIVSSPNGIREKSIYDLGVNISDGQKAQNGYYVLPLSERELAAVKALGSDIKTELIPEQGQGNLFPHNEKSKTWTVDNYGPIWIPKKGATVRLTPENLSSYTRVISVYEDNELLVKDGKVFINGEEKTEYTFKLDYYFMIGDNRHNSEDSRVWGYVPETHIVGKPLFIWFSTKHNDMLKNGINWERIFKSTTGL